MLTIVFFCLDYNHCASSLTVCDKNADCLNGDMTYFCRCRTGYQGDGKTCHLVPTETPLSGNNQGAQTPASSALLETQTKSESVVLYLFFHKISERYLDLLSLATLFVISQEPL